MKPRDRLLFLCIFSLFSLVTLTYFLPSVSSRLVFADRINPGVFSTDSNPYGIPYQQWTAKWWQWIMSIPKQENPNIDNTGQKCSISQDNPKVWYLAPTFGGTATRDCIIPSGKAILFPILTGECDLLSDPTVKTPADLRQCAMSINEGGAVQAEVDGVQLKNLQNYRVQSPVFDFVIPTDNAFGGGTPGTTRAMADGYYVFLQPLSVGKHTIHFSGNVVDNPTLGTNNYATDVTYNVQVRP